jgi:hypothetical protein
MPVNEKTLQELLDKQACAEVMMTYCRGIDHCDEELLRSVFWPDSQHRHGFVGPSSDPSRTSRPGEPGDFVAYALEVLSTHCRTHHQLGNIFIEVEGDVAFTEAYFTAFHRMKANSEEGAASYAFDTQMDFWVGGRYMDRMERRNGEWKISHRIGTSDWQRLDPPSSISFSASPEDIRMKNSRDDVLYHRRERFST